ncbi:DNA mismatch repair protein Msh3 isoform X2 [Hypomesus transpacificus]|uniref:DNA mismatch repair protein Msh3 isoform X2 n=1 Tax=Hypomesus transpacificus TaxID=137520 RepID=UPI001F073E89|nr:DNA mismatch repair protein Msh3 isoform X2 [Hypomesus transpacificus]
MPKSAKKSSNGQTSTSRYFGGASSKSLPDISTKPGMCSVMVPTGLKIGASRGKHKHSTDDDDSRSIRKRPKLYHLGQKEDISRPSVRETNVSLGSGSLSSSTLERLKGFSRMAEPHSRTDRGPDGAERAPEDSGCVPGGVVQDNTKGKMINEEGDEEEHIIKEEEEEEDESKTDPSTDNKFAPPVGGRRDADIKSDGGFRGGVGGGAKQRYTPLEQQFVHIKQQHKDSLLAVECGYKYRFFGEDAEIAAKELNVFCHLDHNFMTCSIPAHRLAIHVRRLVSQGHKVGVVKQTETSAIKSSGVNKNALFDRRLSGLYTRSTLVGEDVNPACCPGDEELGQEVMSDPTEGFLLCLTENWDKLKKQLTIGLVAVQPSTGDVVLDCFSDGTARSELEVRVLKVDPVEILVPIGLSDDTHRLLQTIAKASVLKDDRVRVEKRDSSQFEFSSAMNTITEFYCYKDNKGSQSLSSVAALEAPVICCLGPLIHYLREFNLEKVLLSDSSFRHLSCKADGMMLSASTLRNLEVLCNQTDGGVKGSLLWVLDHTHTPFGKRLMRKWVSQPLTQTKSISERLDAVSEILQSDCASLASIRALLTCLPDLERGVCSIYHKKCSTQEFYLICSSLSRVGTELQAVLPAIQSQLTSSLLQTLLMDTPDMLAPAHNFLKVLNEKAARAGDKKELFSDLTGFPVLQEHHQQIQEVLTDILDHLREVRLTLKTPSLDYTSVSGHEFLIELKNSMSSVVPSDWIKINSTKAVSSQFGEYYHTMKKAISHLATVDCLFSLAEVAKQGNYCRPRLSEQQQIVVREGRHPSIDLLLGELHQYVPNHTQLQGEGQRTMIVTGPNMGGKSSYIRQVALLSIMFQLGSYVPAAQAQLCILDGIYTRMGASDNIYKGRSTFMEELTEVSEIISRATERSLVILDELGRGTSTHDGISIAHATLEHLIRDTKCFTLFVTHYPPLCELENLYPQYVANYHMDFFINEFSGTSQDGEVQPEFITFLYQLIEGSAGQSYGLNVARLADIPEPVLQTAACKAHELENIVKTRRRTKKLLSVLSIRDRKSLLDWMQSNP